MTRGPARAVPWVLGLPLVMVGWRCGPVADGQVVVLYSSATPDMKPDCPPGRCAFLPLESFTCPDVTAETVVVAGHSLPPVYAGAPARAVAQAVACFRPELLVLDTCYGASTPLLDELALLGQAPLVVAPPFMIPPRGLVYQPGFFAPGETGERAMLLSTRPPYPLLRWRLDAVALRAVHQQVDRMDPGELVQRRRRVKPGLVRAPLPSPLAPDGEVLVLVPGERFR
jgi:hypothetical protein